MGIFYTSGKPDYIEWYKCYSDPSKDNWSDGMELFNNPNWDSKQKAKWNFFYRPAPSLVGRPQKRMIKDLENDISNLTYDRGELQKLLIGAGISAIALVFISFFSSLYILLFTIIGSVIFFPSRYNKWKELLNDIEHKNSDIKSLHEEIEALKKQISERPSNKEMESYLQEELRSMEIKCLSEVVNAEIDEDRMDEIIRHEPICDNFRSLPIMGWGLLQPPTLRSAFGIEKTGYNRVVGDIGNNIATWRSTQKNNPLYRVLYVQYIFLLDKNINVYSFFYDFITRKQYGKRSETFQYNHVSNFSIREMELEEKELPENLNLPKSLKQSLFNKEINAFTLAVSSGENFRCVLIDDAVVEGMNEWLELDKMYREARYYDLDKLPDDSSLKNKWGDSIDDIDKHQLLEELVQEKIYLEEKTEHIARKALQQVREGVERSMGALV